MFCCPTETVAVGVLVPLEIVAVGVPVPPGLPLLPHAVIASIPTISPTANILTKDLCNIVKPPLSFLTRPSHKHDGKECMNNHGGAQHIPEITVFGKEAFIKAISHQSAADIRSGNAPA